MSTARTMLALRSAPWSRTASRTRPSATGRPRTNARGLSSAAGLHTGDAHKVEAQVWDHDQEPDLDSLLADPLVGLVMTRDGLSADDVAHFVHLARQRLSAPETDRR